MKSSSESDAESSPFLDEERDLDRDKHERLLPEQPKPTENTGFRLSNWAKSHPWTLNLVFFALNLVILTTTATVGWRRPASSQSSCPLNGPWSPAQESLEYEDRKLGAYVHYGSFTGPPSTEIDAAWRDLMRGITIRIRPDELDKVSEKPETLKLRDGSGYLVTLAAFHELHCLKALRQSFYKDHYWANLTEHQIVLKHEHVEHCLEVLRQSSMCRGDVSVIPSVWEYNVRDGGDGKLLGPSIRDGRAVHRCVKWDKLHDWAKSRRVDVSDEDLLVLPDEHASTGR